MEFLIKGIYSLVMAGALFFVVSCSGESENAVDDDPIEKEELVADLKVMTYNIHLANPPSAGDKRDLQAIANVIKDANPDLVTLQEVDQFTERSGKNIDQAVELGKLTGMNAFFVKAMDVLGGGAYGIAILSKKPILESEAYELNAHPNVGGETRALAVVQIEIKEGVKLHFAGTHLDHRSEENRIFQGTQLNNVLLKKTDPVILAGDFNAPPPTKTVEFFDQDYVRSCRHNCAPTFPAVNSQSAIDFIMYKKGDAIEFLTHKVIQENYASDHLPVIAEVSLKD